MQYKTQVVVERMKKSAPIIGTIAVIHFLLCYSILAFLKVTRFATLGLPDTAFQRFLYRFLGVLAFLDPLRWFHLYANWWNVGLVFALNSIVWTVCFGLLIYGIRSRSQCSAT